MSELKNAQNEAKHILVTIDTYLFRWKNRPNVWATYTAQFSKTNCPK
jgi:hypothetical protein